MLVEIALVVLNGFMLVLWQKDRRTLLNASIARTPQEFKDLERAPRKLGLKSAQPEQGDVEIPFGFE